MKTLFNLASIVLIIVLCITQTSCRKENPSGKMTVLMTDAPANYTEVNVHIVGLQVHHTTSGWIDLPVNQGVYNLLDLQNDVTATLSANTQIPIGQITQLRMILGNNNSIVDSLGAYPLKIPSGAETGLKININQTITVNNHVQILLDFDALSSVVVEGNGLFSLKPVIKLKSVVQS